MNFRPKFPPGTLVRATPFLWEGPRDGIVRECKQDGCYVTFGGENRCRYLKNAELQERPQ